MTTDTRDSTIQRLITGAWAVSVLAHLIGNPAAWWGQALPSPTAAVPILAGAAVAALLLRPDDDRRLRLAVGTTVVLTLTRTPGVPNHLLLIAVVGLAMALAPRARATAAARVGASAYALAALAKANSAFLDPTTSCAPLFADRLVGSWGLPVLPPDIGALTPAATLGIEAVIAVGLLIPASRRHAAALGLGFHGLLALDLDQHFWDFTTALAPVFLAASPAATAVAWQRLTDRFDPHPGDALWPRTPEPTRLLLVPLVPAAALNLFPGAAAAATTIGHIAWLLVGLPVTAAVALMLLRVGAQPAARPRWRPATAALVGVVIAIGALPYLEVSNGQGWDMYANLRVVNGDSNHLLVPAVPLRHGYSTLATVIDASDELMTAHAKRDEQVPETNLRAWAADEPGRWVTYEVDGEHRRVAFGDPEAQRNWEHRWLPLRAVPSTDACRAGRGPAG